MFRRPEAVFLDRDGVINEEVDLLHDPSQLRLIPGSAEAIRMLNHADIPVIVVTNQPVVARNLCTEQELAGIHARLEELLLQHARARLDALYYCPHYPDTSLPGGNPAYLGECECRKPKIGLLLRASREFGLALERCVIIGDSTRDIQTGRNAAMTTILVSTGYGGQDGKHAVSPDVKCPNLLDAVRYVLSWP